MNGKEWKEKTEKSFNEFVRCSEALSEIFEKEHDRGAPKGVLGRFTSVIFGKFRLSMKELFIFWWIFSSMGSMERQLAEISEKLDKKKK